MQRGLWLLLRLRMWSWMRRLLHSMATVRGALFVLLGLGVFAPWMFQALMMVAGPSPEHMVKVRLYGPWFLLSYCVMNLILATGERGLVFSASEVDFLFPAPLGRRELLAYKLLGNCGMALMSAGFLTLALRQHSYRGPAAFVGLFLGLLFVQLFTLALNLLVATIGTRAWSWGRRAVLGGLVLALVVIVIQAGPERRPEGVRAFLQQVDDSQIGQVLLAPLRPFIAAFTAERYWPDLALAALGSMTVLGVLLVVVFTLDANYLEAAATASEKLYSRLQSLRSGGPNAVTLASGKRLRFRPPSLPRLGGIGPIAWRQLTGLPRGRGLLTVGLTTLFFYGSQLYTADRNEDAGTSQILMIFFLTVLWTPMLPCDFRGDLDRIELLKTLPTTAGCMTLGQLFTPWLVMTLLQWLLLASAGMLGHEAPRLLFGAALFAIPFNLAHLALENLLFLWFPTRTGAGAPGDLQNMGRQMVLFLTKVIVLGLMIGIAVACGSLGLVLSRRQEVVAGAVAWGTLLVQGCALVPLIAMAFDRFDVSRDIPH